MSIVSLPPNSLLDRKVKVVGNGSYEVDMSDSALGTLTRIENFFKGMEDDRSKLKSRLAERQAELISAKAELDKPFEHDQKILDLAEELAGIDAELSLDKTAIEPVVDDEKHQNEIKADGDIQSGDEICCKDIVASETYESAEMDFSM